MLMMPVEGNREMCYNQRSKKSISKGDTNEERRTTVSQSYDIPQGKTQCPKWASMDIWRRDSQYRWHAQKRRTGRCVCQKRFYGYGLLQQY